MDCLSYFSNSDLIQLQDCFIPDVDMIIPETDTFFFQAQPQHQLHQPLHHDEALSPSFFQFNHFYEPFLPSQDIVLPNPKTEVFNESQDSDFFYPTPKHQQLINSGLDFNTQDTLFPRPSSNYLFDSYITEASNFPEFLVPDVSSAFKVGWSDQGHTKKPELSAQSTAARKRRRRITEKTQELGKLIPGSQKHNTAEMFHAAAKYVKFLQAQIEILRLSETKMQRLESSVVGRELECLLGSQEIQEKLSTEEVCVVPREMVKFFKSEEYILRNPKISRDVNKLQSINLMN